MTGAAQQILRDVSKASYKQVVAKLQCRFGTKDQQEKFRTELRCRKRRKGETLVELAESIRDLMVRAYSGDQSDGTNAAVAKDYFLSALEIPGRLRFRAEST